MQPMQVMHDTRENAPMMTWLRNLIGRPRTHVTVADVRPELAARTREVHPS